MACYALGNWLNYAINQFDVYTSLSGNTFLFSENISDCNETRGMAEVRGRRRTRHKQFYFIFKTMGQDPYTLRCTPIIQPDNFNIKLKHYIYIYISVSIPSHACTYIIIHIINSMLILFFFTGGQLKTKNGQKYVFNGPPSGVYVSRTCLVVSLLIMVAALISAVIVTYLLTTQAIPPPSPTAR